MLELNFPDYEIKTFKEPRSTLLNTATFGLFGEAEEPAVPARPTKTLGQSRAEEREAQAEEEERSWFDRLTFGIFE